MGARIVATKPGLAAGAYTLEERLLRVPRAAVTTLVLLPTQRHVFQLSRALLERSGAKAVIRPLLYTFPALAGDILRAARQRITPLSPARARLLLRHAVREVAQSLGLSFLARAINSPGYLDALAEFIAELKRAAVHPEGLEETFARAGFRDDRTREIVAIYRVYQRELARREWYDEPGAFWAACEELSRGRPPFLEPVEAVYVDGFWDFTTTQLDLLKLLAEQARETVVTLPLNIPAGQEELFAPVRETAQTLARLLPGATITASDLEPQGVSPTLRAVAERLFDFSAAPATPADPDAVHVVECPSAQRAAQEIARLCKTLLLSGEALPEEIAIVFRDAAAHAPAVARELEQAGVPAFADAPAVTPGVLRVLRTLVELPLGDYRREALVSLLSSAYVDHTLGQPHAPTPAEIDRVTRLANLVRGAEALAEQLACYERQMRAREEAGHAPDCPPALVARVREHLARLVAAVEQAIPPCAPWPEFANGVLRLIEALGIERRLACRSAPRWASADMRALDAVRAELETIAADESFAEKIDRRTFVRELERILEAAVPSDGGRPEGRVLVTDARSVRGLRYKVVIIAGLTEREFPAQRRAGPFYDDHERRKLTEAGVPLQTADERQAMEPLLFLGALAAAQSRLVLAYPATDSRGEKLLTSHYVEALEETLDPPPQRKIIPISQVIAPPEELANPLECMERALAEEGPLERRAAERALETFDAQTGGARQARAAFASACHGWAVEAERWSFHPLGPYDGVLSDPDILADLAQRFGPEHLFSFHQFEAYSISPFQFFARYVLGVDELPEPVLGLDPIARGTLYHQIVCRFYSSGDDLSWPRLREIIFQAFADPFGPAALVPPALREIEREECLRNLRLWLAAEEELREQSDLRPRYLEFAYGRGEAPPLTIAADGEKVRLSGRIDRIDCDDAGGRFAVYDYKYRAPGNAKSVDLDGGLQLALYALAAREVVLNNPQAVCEDWAFCYLARPPRYVPLREGEEGKEEVLEQARQAIARCAQLIREGQFGVQGESVPCDEFCPFYLACRCDRFRVPAKVVEEEYE